MASFTALAPEFRVNSTTAGVQKQSSVAGLSNGGFVATWVTPNAGNNADNVVARIYDASGVAIGAEFLVSNGGGLPLGYATRQDVSALGTGFVVAWESPNQALFHPDSVWTEVFDAAGAGEIEAETGTNQGHAPMIAASTLGGFLTVWEESGVGPDTDQGAIRGGVSGSGGLTINTTTAGHQIGSSIASLQDGTGGYVAAWTEQDGVGLDEMKGQILAADGSKIGGEFSIDTELQGPSERDMDIAARPGAGFAIAYGDSFNTHVKVFGAGNTQLADFNANTPFANEGGDSQSIAVLSNGLLAVAWREFSLVQFSILKVFAPDGTQIGATLNLQSGGGSGLVNDPSIAALANGQFAVTWTDNRGTLGDPDHGITGQRFTTSAAPLINGTAANDTFNGVTQTGYFLGYLGFDTVSYSGAAGPVTVNLLNAALNAGAAAGDEFGNSIERIIGSGFGDTLTGNALANTFAGGGGSDIIDGGDGNDTIHADADGVNDTFAGGAGSADVLDLISATAAAAVSFGAVAFAGTASGGGLGADSFTGIERVYGSNFNDAVTGGGGGEYIAGRGGADSVFAGAGADTVYGGDGNDRIDGGADNDTWLGGDAGADYITGGSGNDRIDGGADNDTWLGGDAGADYITGGLGNDRIDGGADNETWLGGDAGIDYITGGLGDDRIDGGADNDSFLGGGDGADTVTGGAGNDRIDGGADNDSFLGGDAGIDYITGGLGDDRIDGGADGDSLSGEDGADTITGGAGTDTLNGGAANDYLEGGASNDSMTGGAGLDTFDFNLGTGLDSVTDFVNDVDTIRIDPAFGFANVAAVLARTIQSGNHARILLNASGSDSAYLLNYLAPGSGNTIANLSDDIYIA